MAFNSWREIWSVSLSENVRIFYLHFNEWIVESISRAIQALRLIEAAQK